MKTLLALKADYKTLTKSDWKPGCIPPAEETPLGKSSDSAGDISIKIAAQGDKVNY